MTRYIAVHNEMLGGLHAIMGKVITVAQQKGGAGKTTLAAHLGIAAAASGLRVALVDVDQQGSLTQWFALRREALDDATGIVFSAVSGWRASSEIDRLKREFDLVIVDSPPHALTDTKIVVRAANLVIAPVQPSPLDLWATKPTIELAASEHRPIQLVLNRVPSRNDLVTEMSATAARLGAPLLQAKLGNRSSFAAAMAQGRCVTETAPGTVGAREVLKLSREIMALIGE